MPGGSSNGSGSRSTSPASSRRGGTPRWTARTRSAGMSNVSTTSSATNTDGVWIQAPSATARRISAGNRRVEWSHSSG
ncbi:MAG: hypothetical protein ACLP2J_04685 [Acidimicrobiales bacterium]